MATIEQDLQAIRTAVYGEQVRGSIVDAIEQCYTDTVAGVHKADTAAQNANTATQNANTATQNANTAAATANGATANMIPSYSSSSTYSVGDYVTQNNKIYKCATAITTPEAWNAAHWTQAVIGTEVKQIQDDVAELQAGVQTLNETTEDLEARKTDNNGYYEELTAGSAEQLISTEAIVDTTPYLYRKSGGSVDIGNRATLEKIVGGTVNWNQLLYDGNFPTGTTAWYKGNGTLTISNGEATLTITGDTWNNDIRQLNKTVNFILGHKLLIMFAYKMSAGLSGNTLRVQKNQANTGKDVTYSSTYTQFGQIYNVESAMAGDSAIRVSLFQNGAELSGESFTIKNFMIFDLTAMFNPTIADYIYNLETATTGAGVAWFRKLFPKEFYQHNPGEFISVKTSSHDMVGFNLWDKADIQNGYISNNDGNAYGGAASKNTGYLRVIPGATYYFATDATAGGYGAWYDSEKKYISGFAKRNLTETAPNNAMYVRYTVMMNGNGTAEACCINLSHSGSRNGEYEPYEKHSYPLADVELRGPLAIDADGKLVYSGDEYTPDGNVKRKYGIVDLGTVTWTYDANGKFFVYRNDSMISSSGSKKVIDGKYGVATVWAGPASGLVDAADKQTYYQTNNANFFVKDSAYTDAATFKTAMSGVMLVYELATPTTEQAAPYTPVQVVDDWGTEEFVDTREVPIPVGHSTSYMANLRDKLQHLPSLADEDGEYIVKQTGTKMELSKLSSSGLAQSIYESIESTPVASFKDGADGQAMKAVNVAIEPVQDLHGYDAPWPAGGRKNVFPSHAQTQTVSGVTFTANADGTVIANGTATAAIIYAVSKQDPASTSGSYCRLPDIGIEADKSYILNGCPVYTGGGAVPYSLQLLVQGSGQEPIDTGSGSSAFTFNADDIANKWYRLGLRVNNGATLNNVVFKPMIRLATEADSTFVPYSNICPISGWTGAKVTRTGKNLAGPITDHQNGSRITGYTGQGNWPKLKNIYKAGTYSLSVTAYSPDVNGNQADIRMWFHRLSDQKWCNLSGQEAGGIGQIVFPSGAGTITTTPRRYETTFTFPFDCDEITLGYYYSGKYLKYSDLQLELGSTATAYEPYQGQTYEVTFPTEAGTVYGGTLDVAKGKLSIDHAIIDLGSIDWNYLSGSHFYASLLSRGAKNTEDRSEKLNNYCSAYKTTSFNGLVDFAVTYFQNNVRIKDSQYADTASFKTAMSGVTYCFELARAIEITLTQTEIKTLLGANNVWSDAGNIDITYPADTKLYIDSKIAELQALILENNG